MARMLKPVTTLLSECPLVPRVLNTCDAPGILSIKTHSRQEIRLN